MEELGFKLVADGYYYRDYQRKEGFWVQLCVRDYVGEGLFWFTEEDPLKRIGQRRYIGTKLRPELLESVIEYVKEYMEDN